MPGLVPGIHVFLILAPEARRGWPGIGERKRRRPSDGYARPWRDVVVLISNRSNQILPGDDFTEPCVVCNELLDEFMHAVLEDIIHMAVFQPVADAAGVALGGALASIGNPDLVEIAHQVAIAAGERPRQ